MKSTHYCLLLFCCLINMNFQLMAQQKQMFSTSANTNGIITVSTSEIVDNKFSITLEVNWVDAKLSKIQDNKSVLVLRKGNLTVSDSNYIDCENFTKEKSLLFNSYKFFNCSKL